jgi:hypothetical protein
MRVDGRCKENVGRDLFPSDGVVHHYFFEQSQAACSVHFIKEYNNCRLRRTKQAIRRNIQDRPKKSFESAVRDSRMNEQPVKYRFSFQTENPAEDLFSIIHRYVSTFKE